MAELRYVKGLSDCLQSLREFSPKFRKRVLARATQAAAIPIRNEAIQIAPEYHGEVSKGHPPPGTLKNSIIENIVKRLSNDQRVTYNVRVLSGTRVRTKKTDSGRTFDPTTGKRSFIHYTFTETTKQGGAYYWWWVEFGTSKMSGRHFMRSALQNAAQAGIDAFAAQVRAGLNEVVAR